MPTSWSKQAYEQGFDCEYITLKHLLTYLIIWELLSLFTKV